MTRCDKPRLPLPEPLRGSDADSFTHYSIVVRLPDIGRRTLAENDFPADASALLQILIDEIPEAPLRPLSEDQRAADAADWDRYVAPYLGGDWLQPPWFFIEAYFYRRVLEATGYFRPGAGYQADPFAYQKKQGLLTTWEAIRALAEKLTGWLAGDSQSADTLAKLLAIDLWGNQSDLSLWPAGREDAPGHDSHSQQREHTLVDDSAAVAAYLKGQQGQPGRVDFLIDNAGFELVCDLCLADYLLASGLAQTVHLHLKAHPTFVSDALIDDVLETVAFLAGEADTAVQALAARLSYHLERERLMLATHAFWTSPLEGWQMPEGLLAELARSRLVISKGDANYRRLLGDRHWPFTTPFADVVCYFPAPLLALRTGKSETMVGLQPGQAEAAAARDADWLINGRWGVIQFAEPGA